MWFKEVVKFSAWEHIFQRRKYVNLMIYLSSFQKTFFFQHMNPLPEVIEAGAQCTNAKSGASVTGGGGVGWRRSHSLTTPLLCETCHWVGNLENL